MKLCPQCFGPLIGGNQRCLHCEGDRPLGAVPVPPRAAAPTRVAPASRSPEPQAEPEHIWVHCPLCGEDLDDITFVCRVCNNALVRFEPGDKAPNCTRCKYYKITHQRDWPRLCRVFNFKGKGLPSHYVFSATGKHCPFFAPIEAKENA